MRTNAKKLKDVFVLVFSRVMRYNKKAKLNTCRAGVKASCEGRGIGGVLYVSISKRDA